MASHKTFLLLLPVVLIQTTLSHAFIVVVNVKQPLRLCISSPSLLSAAAASSKKKKKRIVGGSSGGGFGSSSSSSSVESSSSTIGRRRKEYSTNDDGGGDKNIVYHPELDPHVVETLIPYYNYDSAVEGLLGQLQGGGGGGILPIEMYDRLDEIYGFEKFNFGGENAIYKSIETTTTTTDDTHVRASSSLFDDILSGGHSTLVSDNNSQVLFPSSLLSSSSSSSLSDVVSSRDRDSNSSSSFDLNAIPPFMHFRILHTDPMVLAIDNFFTMEECDRYIQLSNDSELREDRQQRASVDVDDDEAELLIGFFLFLI